MKTTLAPRVSVSLAVFSGASGAALTIANAAGQLKSFSWAIIPLFSLAGMALLYAIATAFFNRTTEENPQTSTNPQHKQEQRVEANPHQEQHVHLGDELLRRIATPSPQPPEVKPEVPDIRPQPSRVMTLHELFPASRDDAKYLIVPFRNESTVAQDRKFSAHIAYKRADGSEIAEVPNASWFAFTGNPGSATLPAKMSRKLAVLRLQNGKFLTGGINWLHQQIYHQDIWQPEPRPEEITEPIHTIEITLRGFGLPLLSFVFDFDKDTRSLRWREPSGA